MYGTYNIYPLLYSGSLEQLLNRKSCGKVFPSHEKSFDTFHTLSYRNYIYNYKWKVIFQESVTKYMDVM